MIEDTGTYDSPASKTLSLENLKRLLRNKGADSIYVKKLAPNDNSKNQPYFGSHLTDLAFIPTGTITASNSDSEKTKDPKRKIKYQAHVAFKWIDAEGQTFDAPNSKLIYYPQYPEVRLSGFLQGSKVKASKWMAPEKKGRSEGRWLVIGISPDDVVYAYLVTPECELTHELDRSELVRINNVFSRLDISLATREISTRQDLLHKLHEIHLMGWVTSQKLDSNLQPRPYQALNAGGYTLEALLGIPPNSFAEPDYLGWEVKQFGVKAFPAKGAGPATLMTPEPDGGDYVTKGVPGFLKERGYPDKKGKIDRLNFGGIYRAGIQQPTTKITLHISGYDLASRTILDSCGAIELLDNAGHITASWSFAKLMDHWKRKHSQAVYVPCQKRVFQGQHEYHYGNIVELGSGTTFDMMLAAIGEGKVYYDPAMKLEQASSTKPKTKRRSQFRIKHSDLGSLYSKFENVDVLAT